MPRSDGILLDALARTRASSRSASTPTIEYSTPSQTQVAMVALPDLVSVNA
jgi:hypothetical protein